MSSAEPKRAFCHHIAGKAFSDEIIDRGLFVRDEFVDGGGVGKSASTLNE